VLNVDERNRMSARGRLRIAIAHVCAVALSFAVLADLPAPANAAGKLPSEKQWHKDIAKVMDGSHAYIDRATKYSHKKYAINFDIDNSTIASHYRPGTAIPRVLRFARYAKRQGVALLFNTARAGAPLKKARAELTKAGYRVTKVCGRKSRQEPVAHGKQRCRARFIRQGFTIIANVGNHTTDFSGPKNYGRAFRLPNYGALS
jgi:predicted secreted acid phosphatase